MPDRLVASLLSGPWIAPALAAWTVERLQLAAPSHPVPLPAAIGRAERWTEKPRPVLTLDSFVLPFDPEKLSDHHGRYSHRGHLAAVALLGWRYGPLTAKPGDTWRSMLCDGGKLEVERDPKEAVAMGAGQRDTYEAIRLAMHTRVRQAIAERGLAQSGIVILDALLKMRQACCDPRLLKVPGLKKVGASAKLERLMKLLPVLIEEGRRVLLFSQFTSMLALIQAELDAARVGYVSLTGDTVDRRTPIARFQAGKVPLFLISLKAGGVGLNLTAADTVIHYDPWWNPAVEDQATDRAYRIGQDKPVFVHRLITEGTVEQKMEALKARKQALAAGVLGDAAEKALTLTEGDLDVLFAAAP